MESVNLSADPPPGAYTGADLDRLWSLLSREPLRVKRMVGIMRPRMERLEALLRSAPSPTRCPPDCGKCCDRDVGVFTLPEFLLVVARILEDRVPAPPPDPGRRHCLFWNHDVHCTVHPYRPLLCRYFGVAEAVPLLGTCAWIRSTGPLPPGAVRPQEALKELDRIAGALRPRPPQAILSDLKAPAYWIAAVVTGARPVRDLLDGADLPGVK